MSSGRSVGSKVCPLVRRRSRVTATSSLFSTVRRCEASSWLFSVGRLTLYRCLGKGFAVANMKIALAVILRRFSLELPDGPDTKFEPVRTAVIRVKTAGQKGCKVPMRIRRVE
jgi:hypothetical protein